MNENIGAVSPFSVEKIENESISRILKGLKYNGLVTEAQAWQLAKYYGLLEVF